MMEAGKQHPSLESGGYRFGEELVSFCKNWTPTSHELRRLLKNRFTSDQFQRIATDLDGDYNQEQSEWRAAGAYESSFVTPAEKKLWTQKNCFQKKGVWYGPDDKPCLPKKFGEHRQSRSGGDTGLFCGKGNGNGDGNRHRAKLGLQPLHSHTFTGNRLCSSDLSGAEEENGGQDEDVEEELDRRYESDSGDGGGKDDDVEMTERERKVEDDVVTKETDENRWREEQQAVEGGELQRQVGGGERERKETKEPGLAAKRKAEEDRSRRGRGKGTAVWHEAERHSARCQLTPDAFQPWNGSGASRPFSREITRSRENPGCQHVILGNSVMYPKTTNCSTGRLKRVEAHGDRAVTDRVHGVCTPSKDYKDRVDPNECFAFKHSVYTDTGLFELTCGSLRENIQLDVVVAFNASVTQGEPVKLECHIIPHEYMEFIQWERNGTWVLHFNLSTRETKYGTGFEGRVRLAPDCYAHGDWSLMWDQALLEDQGDYFCSAYNQGVRKEWGHPAAGRVEFSLLSSPALDFLTCCPRLLHQVLLWIQPPGETLPVSSLSGP
ncbi:hypothetical protein D9C73_000106 [Collichthys lucidus]|uniref:Ig-like domain-containing protein n=1 Tax=Collichthys lucidus TaxID=240159 RepID=A0A4U5TX39_COLLU|nr:hypothetical protein D9C73_000106 [Collichthys lucidus]